MKVKAFMTPTHKLTLLKPSDSAQDAISKINEKGILSLPVVDDRRFIDFLSKEYVYETFFNGDFPDKNEFLKMPISEFLLNQSQPISPDLSIEEAAKIFFDNNVRFIPVVNEKNEFLGIVTHKVIFNLLTKVYGLEDPKILIVTNDYKGSISKITEIISKNGGNITNIVQMDTTVKGVAEVTIRVTGKDIPKIREKLEKSGYQVL